jgi:hypothetical protein
MAYIPELTALEETLASGYDLSAGSGTFTSSDIADYNSFSIQFICTGFSGTADMQLEQSLDNTNWDIIENSKIDLNASNCNFTLQQRNWMSKYVRVVFNTAAAGSMTIQLLAKK